jgi:hypothetical protein
MNQGYIDTVRLLLAAAPVVFETQLMAMKGGTAINLFVRDLPRLSVDIDAVFVDHSLDRASALAAISTELNRVKRALEKIDLTAEVATPGRGEESKLFISDGSVQVKVEVNFVFRGTVLPTERRTLAASAQEMFTTGVEVPVLQAPELYGSKLVAAMDRQHPRDLFDVHMLLSHEGLDARTIDCFVAYLVGHNRPIHEVLFPNPKDLAAAYEADFVGMTREDVPLEILVHTQADLHRALPNALTPEQREFLRSVVRLEPAWELMPFTHLRDLPAVRWKLENLNRLRTRSRRKFEAQFAELDARLDGT